MLLDASAVLLLLWRIYLSRVDWWVGRPWLVAPGLAAAGPQPKTMSTTPEPYPRPVPSPDPSPQPPHAAPEPNVYGFT